MIRLLDLPGMRHLANTAKAKIVRHQDRRYDMGRLLAMGHFNTYQSFQGRQIFAGCDTILSFIGTGGTRARLVGVYRVGKCHKPGSRKLPANYPDEMDVAKCYFYELTREPSFDDLAERVVINWGTGTRSWCQRLRDREVIEILPAGYARDFPGHFDFILSYAELSRIVGSPDAHREWHRRLESVAGIYVITDQVDQIHYVGSAYGASGLLGRWRTYAEKPDGGNKRLRELLKKHPGRHLRFNFAVLRALDRSVTRAQVLELEAHFKKILGSRAVGLNAN
jgi:hypothetical protein